MKGILTWLKTVLGQQVVGILLNTLLTKENVLKAVDYILDQAENFAAETSTDLDDKALKIIREALNVPDNDQ